MKPHTHYQVIEADPNEYIFVENSSNLVTANFTQAELYNPKTGLDTHPIAVAVIDALQTIRDYFGFPIRVNSTYRNYIPTDGVGAASTSPHMLAQAIDFSFLTDQQIEDDLYMSIRDDFDQKGELFQILWDKGVRGFGSYDTFIHIDVVVSELYPPFKAKRTSQFQGQRYARWNKMKTLRYKSPTIRYTGKEMESAPVTNSIQETIQEGLGVISGYASELLDAEDRGKDFTQRSGFYLSSIILGGLLFVFFVFSWKR